MEYDDHEFVGLVIKGEKVMGSFNPILTETIPKGFYVCEARMGVDGPISLLEKHVERDFYATLISDKPLLTGAFEEIDNSQWDNLDSVPQKYVSMIPELKIDWDRVEIQKALCEEDILTDEFDNN